ncbi:CAP domain-containing protein [Streptomyces yokosukanensis]|uniref:CAP domain-containing protein n=1 Tax=Streptomyces yokosukanensis TaxID=67386 RepID=UPI000A79594C|nr:CAP domain-containing protein [Streptomyces yokosukanensis]
MTTELVAGGNVPLPAGAVLLRVAGPFDVSGLVGGADGRVGSDADFVFYNQPRAPGVRLRDDALVVEPARLRGGAGRVTVVLSAAEPGTPLGRLPAPRLEVADGSGRAIARFTPPRLGPETVLLLAELYLRPGIGWKLRAVGQGYADGLAGLARDFGVDVLDDAVQTTSAVAGPAAPAAPTGPAAPTTATVTGPRPGPASGRLADGSADGPADEFLRLVNSARARAGSPAVGPDPRLGSAARSHARAMADAGRLGAEGRDGVSVHQRITAAGYAYVAVGEHLVSGPRSPAEFVEYCLDSPRPRRTLLDPAFRHAALARADAGDRYWTALWAAPLTPDALSHTAAEVVALTNTERGRAGLPPLTVDPLLTVAAQAHCADMVARDFYDHTAPDGSQPWDRAAAAGSRLRTVGENIACGQRSPAEVVDGWMNSPGHRANILKREFGHIGVGFAGGGRAGTYWTQLFGG